MSRRRPAPNVDRARQLDRAMTLLQKGRIRYEQWVETLEAWARGEECGRTRAPRVRLVTPPGGLVLDPFAGSGTTGAAAMLEGAAFLGIERDATMVRVARARIDYWRRKAGR